MTNMKTIWGGLLLLLCTAVLPAQTAEEIIRKSDALQSYDSLRAEGSLITVDRFGTKTVDFISWSAGDSDFLIEFTSAAERGQKILRNADQMFLYYPDAEEVIRLQGAALRQSLMGSDISYEDMTEGNDTLDRYEVILRGEESVDGTLCYVIDMKARSRRVAYPRQVVWIGKDSLMPLKAHYLSKSEKLLKEMKVLETKKIDGRVFITAMVLEDKLKKNSRTEMIMDKVDVDIPVEDDFFSLDQLSW